MRCDPAIVLRASSTVGQGAQQLSDVADDRRVVVVRDHDVDVQYYVFTASALRARLPMARATDDLASALYLDEFWPAVADQLSPVPPPVGAVALEGHLVVGVVVDDDDGPWSTTRSATAGSGSYAGSYADGPGMIPGPGSYGGSYADGPGAIPDDGSYAGGYAGSYAGGYGGSYADGVADGPAAVADDDLMDQVPPGAVGAVDKGLFHAYPDVKAPSQAGIGVPFTIDVGFARQPPPSMLIEGPPIMVVSGPKTEFIVHVAGFGFIFPDGIQRTLVADRDEPETARATFTVAADPSEAATLRVLQISYEFAGAVVGRTWAQIQITPDTPTASVTPAPAGGSGVIVAIDDAAAPHLSVDILSDQGRSQLDWVFHTRYSDIRRPTDAVTTNLDDDSARSFAVQLMKQIPALQKGPLLPATMEGIGKRVADALPRDFWLLLAQAWQRAKAAGEQPRMQITLTEPWVPWELAWIDDQRFPEAADLLPADAKGGATLGQLWQVARWTTPMRQLNTGGVPASPPASEINAEQMVVITGDYGNLPGVKTLPDAVEEGNTIARTYGALPLTASEPDVTSLMNGNLQRGGQEFRPTAIHFAGHGQTDLSNPQFTGLVLADGRRLDPIAIGGFPLVSEQKPFVFLNACEAGVADETLMSFSGMVGAFLREGARGFVAPLWKVDDGAAREVALEFYQRTFSHGETVGEAMRGIRRTFHPDAASATSLAYVFYGNPDLRFDRGTA